MDNAGAEDTNSSMKNISILSFLFMFFWFSLLRVDATAARHHPVSQVVGEAEVYIRLFPSHHKKLFFSIIIQGSLFINIFYKTNINFTSPAAAAGSMTRWDWKCLMRTFNNLTKRLDTLKTESKVWNQNGPQILVFFGIVTRWRHVKTEVEVLKPRFSQIENEP